MGGWETIVAEPAAGHTPEELADRFENTVDAFDLSTRIEKGYVLCGWPDTGDWLGETPTTDRLDAVDGLARICYVYRNDTTMTETVVYFERVDGDVERVELRGGEWYGDGLAHVRDTYGMDVDRGLVG